MLFPALPGAELLLGFCGPTMNPAEAPLKPVLASHPEKHVMLSAATLANGVWCAAAAGEEAGVAGTQRPKMDGSCCCAGAVLLLDPLRRPGSS